MTEADRRQIERRALEISAGIQASTEARNAEIVPDVEPHWHAIEAYAGQERAAAKELSERAFGIYLPEFPETIVRRGRKFEMSRLLVPGYVFAFVWDIEHHRSRILACEHQS